MARRLGTPVSDRHARRSALRTAQPHQPARRGGGFPKFTAGPGLHKRLRALFHLQVTGDFRQTLVDAGADSRIRLAIQFRLDPISQSVACGQGRQVGR